MPETGLTLTYPELQAQVAWFLFGTDDPTRVSPTEQNMLARCLNNGLRRFYYPAQVDGLNHDWSFLKSEFTLQTETGTQDYLMPFDFGGLDGPLHHVPSDNIRIPVVKTTVENILKKREYNISLSLWPIVYAERAVHSGGRQSTRYQLLLWPSPSAAFTFKGTQRILPLAPNGSAQEFLYGGVEHSQTILEACLAQAELMLENKPGAHTAEFQSCLRTSIILDAQMHAPEYLGYNGDAGADGTALMRDGRHFENFSPVTVGGSVFSGH